MSKEVNRREFGLRVAQRRKHLGFSQTTLAESVGMRQQGLAEIERGKVARPRLMRELAAALMASEEWLLFGDGPKPAERSSDHSPSQSPVDVERRLAFESVLVNLPPEKAEMVLQYARFLAADLPGSLRNSPEDNG